MRHYDTSCGPMSCVSMRKDGIPEFVIKALYCRVVVYYSDTISEITSVVMSGESHAYALAKFLCPSIFCSK